MAGPSPVEDIESCGFPMEDISHLAQFKDVMPYEDLISKKYWEFIMSQDRKEEKEVVDVAPEAAADKGPLDSKDSQIFIDALAAHHRFPSLQGGVATEIDASKRPQLPSSQPPHAFTMQVFESGPSIAAPVIDEDKVSGDESDSSSVAVKNKSKKCLPLADSSDEDDDEYENLLPSTSSSSFWSHFADDKQHFVDKARMARGFVTEQEARDADQIFTRAQKRKKKPRVGCAFIDDQAVENNDDCSESDCGESVQTFQSESNIESCSEADDSLDSVMLAVENCDQSNSSENDDSQDNFNLNQRVKNKCSLLQHADYPSQNDFERGKKFEEEMRSMQLKKIMDLEDELRHLYNERSSEAPPSPREIKLQEEIKFLREELENRYFKIFGTQCRGSVGLAYQPHRQFEPRLPQISEEYLEDAADQEENQKESRPYSDQSHSQAGNCSHAFVKSGKKGYQKNKAMEDFLKFILRPGIFCKIFKF